jgi:RNA polymerase sigma-70 factor (ECF subfamily)
MGKLLEYQLILRSKQGDASAFGALIKDYRRQLFTYLLKLCNNRTTAEDLFQDTLIRVWSGLPNYNEQNKFSSWLFSIAHNTAMDSYRRKKVRSRVIHTDELPEAPETRDPQVEVEHKETKELLLDAVNNLSDKQKQVFLLRQHGELSFKEIAELTQQPLNTVLSHMHYSVKKIRKILREQNVI